MAKRLFDVVAAAVGLTLTAPLLLIAAVGIRLTSPGPILYRARRTGRGGRSFAMYKLRTMHVATGVACHRVTAVGDPRVFPLGRLLRRTKIDELPQLVNVLRGDMSIIGPRPEDPDIVAAHYRAEDRETLRVRPGLASPGSLYHDTHGHRYLQGGDVERLYVETLLPVKLALDGIYVRRSSLWYDVRLVVRTFVVVAARVMGRRAFRDPPELGAARLAVHNPGAGGRPTAAAAVLLLCVLQGGCGVQDADGPAGEPALTWDVDSADAILVGAGDIARCDSDVDEATARLLDEIPGTVFTTGDNVYPDGTAADFDACYAPSWGRHRERTRPVPGNHDYHTDGAAGYFAYFGDGAGEPGKGYYSYALGAWHVVALNSQLDLGRDAPQLAWLRDDLARHPTRCTLAYWHTPRFSSGATHGDAVDMRAVWDVLYAAGAEVVLNGHEHHYERFAPQAPDGVIDREFGIRQFVVGTGGGSTYDFADAHPGSEVRLRRNPGVLALRLLPNGYEWQFVPVTGRTSPDAGVEICHDAPPATRLAIARGAP